MKTTKPVVYIAGPISKGDLEHNVKQADAAFEKLVRAGFAPINPMWSCFSGSVQRDEAGRVIALGTTTGGLNLTHAEWLGTDLPVVERCDAVFRLPGESRGADMETAHADENSVPVYHDLDELIADKWSLLKTTHEFYNVDFGDESPVGIVSIFVDDGGIWPDAEPGDTVRSIGCTDGRIEISEVVDVYHGKVCGIPATFLERSTDPKDKTYASFLTSFVRPVCPDATASIYLMRRIA